MFDLHAVKSMLKRKSPDSNESGKCRVVERTSKPPADFKLSPDTEVELIRRLLERKYDTKIRTRVSLDGYIDEPRYSLVLYEQHDRLDGKLGIVFGGTTDDVLNVSKAFIDEYWRKHDKFSGKPRPDDYLERSEYDRWKKAEVVSSRDELLLIAAVEGDLN